MLSFLYTYVGLTKHRMPLVLVFAAVFAYLLCFPIRWVSHRYHLLDRPGKRSSHETPTPRTGGVAIILGGLLATLLVTDATMSFWTATLIGGWVALASLVDDIKPISPIFRLIIQTVVAGLTVWKIDLVPRTLGLPYIDVHWPYWVGLILATFFVVMVVNFYNFMDGINGQAGFQGLLAGVTFSCMLYFGHSGNSVYAAAALGGACMGYLPHNFPKAHLFMGDVGSTTLGFGLAMLCLLGGTRTGLPWMAFILPLAFFILPPAITVSKRVLTGHNPLRAHREFHHHLLLRCGWDHYRATRMQTNVMFLCAAAGWFYAWQADWVRALLLAGTLMSIILYSIGVHLYFRYKRIDAPPGTVVEPAGSNA